MHEHPEHTPARKRGERLKLLTESIVGVLGRHSLDEHDKILIFHVLADDIFGNLPIDTPNFGGPYERPR